MLQDDLGGPPEVDSDFLDRDLLQARVTQGVNDLRVKGKKTWR